MPDPAFSRRGKRRFDDDEPTFAKRNRHRSALPALDAYGTVDGLPDGDRWSSWDQSAAGERGPRPYPDWLVTELAAADTELGILKTGKEADVFLLRRGVPGTGRSCLLAAKRYRDAGHRMFHRDSEYLEGRRVRESRASRAMAGPRVASSRASVSVPSGTGSGSPPSTRTSRRTSSGCASRASSATKAPMEWPASTGRPPKCRSTAVTSLACLSNPNGPGSSRL